MANQQTASSAMHKDIEELEQLLRQDASPQVFLPLAEAYIRRGYPLEAIRVCQKGLKSADTLEGRVLLARAYFDASAQKKAFLKKAHQEIEAALSQDPNHWEALSLRGEILLEEGDLQQARESLQKAHQLNPHHPQARMLLLSIGVDVDIPDDQEGPFFINVDTNFIPVQTDSLSKTIRDILLFFVVILGGVWLYAQNSIHEKKIRALVILGRTQQNTDSFSGLKKSIEVYKKVIDTFDPFHPFALLHLAESSHTLWKNHDRQQAYYDEFMKHYNQLESKASSSLLNLFAGYHALKATVAYENAMRKQEDGKLEEADREFKVADEYLTKKSAEVAQHPRLVWIQGLLQEAMRKDRVARAYLKRAAELGWNNAYFRYRYGYSYFRARKFSDAHGQFKNASEQGQQNKDFVAGELANPDKQKNAFCWIDPPLLLTGKITGNVPVGQELGTFDLLQDAANAAIKAEVIPKCSFHPSLQDYFSGHKHYVMADIADVLAVLDSGVGMSAAFDMNKTVLKTIETVKKDGDFSPHTEAWFNFLQAKVYWYQNEYTKARDAIEKALKIAPYEGYFHSLNGMLAGQNKKYDEAWASFEKALKLEPYLPQIYYEAASTMLDDRDDEKKPRQSEKVEKLIEQLRKNFGQNETYFYLSGKLLEAKNKIDEAEEMWAKAIKEDYEHYESNLARGKLRLQQAEPLRPTADKKDKLIYNIKKEHFPALLRYLKLYDARAQKKFKERKESFEKRIKNFTERLKTEKDAGKIKRIKEMIKEDEKAAKTAAEEVKGYQAFIATLKDEKTPKAADIELHVGTVLELIDEDAGSYLEQAMQTRPGAAEPRYWIGKLWFSNRRWSDAQGHLDVALIGYLRDLDYKNALKTAKLLVQNLIRSEKEPKEGIEKAEKIFKQKVLMLTRQESAKVKAEKTKLIGEGKTEAAEKVKAKPEAVEEAARTFKLYASAMEDIQALKETADQFNSDAETAQKEGFIALETKLLERAKADAEKQSKPGAKKGKKRRR